jgi:hypothetical protein
MTAWSDFCRKYSTENGITYTAASKLPEVKELYKLQKTEELKEQTAIFEEKLAEAIEIFEAEKALEVLEVLEPDPEPLLIAEVPEDAIVTVTFEPPAPPQTPKVFISKIKKVKTIGLKRT